MKKAILFDFDNTLGNRTLGCYKAYHQFFEQYDCFMKLNHVNQEALIQDCLTIGEYGAVNFHDIVEKINQKYNFSIDSSICHTYWKENLGKVERCYQDSEDTLKYLKNKGYKLAIVTNGSSYSQHLKITNSGIESYFDCVVVSGDIGVAKPEPAIFHEALNRLDVKAHEAIFVGDTYSIDIVGAYNVGIEPIWIWPEDGRINTDGIKRIKCLSELKEIL